MKALVTGGAGFIGSHLVDRLLELGHEVVVLDDKKSIDMNDKAINYEADICNFGDTRSLYDGIDYVFHLAADTSTMATINNPMKTNFINSFGTNVVLQCSREARVKRVVYVSTYSVYGKNKIPNKETQTPDFINPYSLSKFQGEQLCKLYSSLFKLETIILRPFVVYGDRQPKGGQYSPIMHLFDLAKTKNNPIKIIGKGENKKDFIHVSDFVEACIISATVNLDKKHIASEFNIGSGKNYSTNEIGKIYNHPISYTSKKDEEVKHSLANIEKSQSLLGWTPKIKLKDWIIEKNV
jgi:UDP-glucose 4-epimerase